jgi:hypothetical protein
MSLFHKYWQKDGPTTSTVFVCKFMLVTLFIEDVNCKAPHSFCFFSLLIPILLCLFRKYLRTRYNVERDFSIEVCKQIGVVVVISLHVFRVAVRSPGGHWD